jgi:hypothetical protein
VGQYGRTDLASKLDQVVVVRRLDEIRRYLMGAA